MFDSFTTLKEERKGSDPLRARHDFWQVAVGWRALLHAHQPRIGDSDGVSQRVRREE